MIDNILINEQIRAKTIFLVEKKEMLTLEDARKFCADTNVDLVQVAVRADGIAVCKAIDWESFRYYSEKKKRQIKKQEQKKHGEKTLRVSLVIGDNDLERKMLCAIEWLKEGKTVNIVIMRRKRRQKQSMPIDTLKDRIKLRLIETNCKFKDSPNPQFICAYI